MAAGTDASILVCDDALGFRTMLAAFLKDAGHAVAICATWDEAVVCAAEHRPAAILVDLWMPTFQPELLRRVHEVSPESAIVVVSAFPVDVSERSVAGIAGITAVVSKRDRPDVIVEAVTDAVSGARGACGPALPVCPPPVRSAEGSASGRSPWPART
jgi:DNA-binding NarL/FixJ family response regulator